ncbi:MAG: hypothetical protein DMG03_04060 [Acidobacteria bacterium]|nr:MAG: hypothetical protein DMG03_04060 [Acidobacteriota bacterium]
MDAGGVHLVHLHRRRDHCRHRISDSGGDSRTPHGMSGFAGARRVLADAIGSLLFPAATAEVGDSTRTLWQDALGTLTFDADAPETRLDTPFDLASLTKVIATATAMMDCVSNGALTLGARVAEFFDDWRGEDRDSVSIRDLLEHASGLPGRLVDAPPEGRREFEHEICKVRLEYPARARSIYSDLGFILLGFVAENLGRDLATAVAAIGLNGRRFAAGPSADRRGARQLRGRARRRRRPCRSLWHRRRRRRFRAGDSARRARR